MMKLLIYFNIFFIVLLQFKGESQCYASIRQLGIESFNQGRYGAAKYQFESAKKCKTDKPSNNDLDAWISKCVDKISSKEMNLYNNKNIIWISEYTTDFNLFPEVCFYVSGVKEDYDMNRFSLVSYENNNNKNGLFDDDFRETCCYLYDKIIDDISDGIYETFKDKELTIRVNPKTAVYSDSIITFDRVQFRFVPKKIFEKQKEVVGVLVSLRC